MRGARLLLHMLNRRRAITMALGTQRKVRIISG